MSNTNEEKKKNQEEVVDAKDETTTEDTATDNDETTSTTSSSAGDVADEVTNLKAQLESEKHRRLSLMADFENYKKRMDSEKALFGAMANMSLIREILEIFDDIGLALNDEALDVDAAKTSLKSTRDKISMISKMAGVEPIEIKVGDDFDKEKMEAIQAIPDENNKNKVVAVISSAYKYTNKDGILKAAKVIVGK